MFKFTTKKILYPLLICLLILLSLTVVGCTSGNDSPASEPPQSGMENDAQEKEMMFAKQDVAFADTYSETMGQCMFIDEGSVELLEDGQSGQVLAEITIKDDMTEDFLKMRMEQHINALIEQYSSSNVELVAKYHDGVEAGRAMGANGEVTGMEINVK